MTGSTRAIYDEIEIHVPCKAEYVRTIRRTIVDFAESHEFTRDAIEDISLAVSEAVANIVRHAYEGIDCSAGVYIKCVRTNGDLVLEVSDRGNGFNAPEDTHIPVIDFNRAGGMGIYLMKKLMDRVTYVSVPNEGTKIKMTKHARTAMAKMSRQHRDSLKQLVV